MSRMIVSGPFAPDKVGLGRYQLDGMD